MFTIITGTQFGDEGKGKIVDLIANKYDIIVRFQGGDNAGHTVQVGDSVYKLHLVPSGFLLNKKVLIGPGVVLNPKVLLNEIEMIKKTGIEIEGKVGVDPKASVIMPYHIELDKLREEKRIEKIGTTKRGIGFAYIDKIARDEIQIKDIIDENTFRLRLKEIREQKEREIEVLGGDFSIVINETLIKEYLLAGEKIKDFVTDVSYDINKALDSGKNVLAEGAQGTYLDVIHGTQKFVTSSNTVAGSACTNLGVGPTKVNKVIGIVKAYITRVGAGPLPTELLCKTGEQIQKAGAEFGTTTGRKRRCGWFDLPLMRKSIYLNGYTDMVLTKIDVLMGLKTIKVCTGYKLDGKIIEYPPELTNDLMRCIPIYKELPGFKEDISEILKYQILPETAKGYIEYLEKEMGVNIEYISVGPRREQTFRR